QPSCAYDITFSPLRHNQHSMSFHNYGNNPPLKVVQELAKIAGYSSWQTAKIEIEKIVQTIATFHDIAKNFPLKQSIINEIQKKLNAIYHDNKNLWQ
ncbi:MAG: hypothetical protein J5680_01835, partial [Neisseriaceae bacterium]|nr:hypothetical protein [Neisseriaceae bacterium]